MQNLNQTNPLGGNLGIGVGAQQGIDIGKVVEALRDLPPHEIKNALTNAVQTTIDELSKNPKLFDPHTLGTTFIRNACHELTQAINARGGIHAFGASGLEPNRIAANSAQALLGTYAAIVKAGYDIAMGEQPTKAFSESTFHLMDQIARELEINQYENFLNSRDGERFRTEKNKKEEVKVF